MRARGRTYMGRTLKVKLHVGRNNERLKVQPLRRPLLTRVRCLDFAQLALTGLTFGRAAPAATRDFFVMRVRAYIPGRTSCACALLRSARGGGGVRCANHLWREKSFGEKGRAQSVKNVQDTRWPYCLKRSKIYCMHRRRRRPVARRNADSCSLLPYWKNSYVISYEISYEVLARDRIRDLIWVSSVIVV